MKKKLILIILTIAVLIPVFGCNAGEKPETETPDQVNMPEPEPTLKADFSIKEIFDEFENTDWNLTAQDIGIAAKYSNSKKISDAEIEIPVKVNDCEMNKKYHFLNAGKLDGFTYAFMANADTKTKYKDLYNKVKQEMKSRYGEFIYDQKDEQSGEPKCFSKTDYGFISLEIIEGTSENSAMGANISIIFYSKDSISGNALYNGYSKS